MPLVRNMFLYNINVSNTPKKSSTAMLNFIKDGNKKDICLEFKACYKNL